MKRILVCLTLAALFLTATGAAAAAGPPYLALTFDDGPSGQYTTRLLEGLAARSVPATFFLCGYRLEQYPRMAEQIAAGGHEIGLHGYTHENMAQMDAPSLARELDNTAALLREQAGITATLLRPPGGLCSRTVEQAAEARGLALVAWSVDPRDWAVHDAERVAAHILAHAADGDIVLLHDMFDSSVDAALQAVDALRDRGFCFVTVSELAARRQTALRPGKLYYALAPGEDALPAAPPDRRKSWDELCCTPAVLRSE